MNKNAIKKFAVEARKKLIASVSDRAGMLGITPEGCSEPVTKGADFEVYKTIAGTEVTLSKTQCEQRRKLKEQIENRGFEAVVEEVAYTWFNRICAIRFMEVNDYLPTRVRVLSSEKEGKNEPDIVTQAPDVDLDFTDKEREYILDCKMNNKLDELFKMLFIKQCNKLSEILPELFEATEDYTEMLLNISYTNKDDIIYMLVNPETGIPEADFNVSTIGEDGQPTGQVEIIGWLYQYYNTELKDDTFAQLKKNVKISKERIPAATQLFTPDWIVRYMVENSVGRLWIEHLRAVDPNVNEKEVAERFGWKYYFPEAEQEENVNIKLAEIRTSYKDLKPEDITCIDPCMGSGHILVAIFDVLMDIYKSVGYSERDAAFEIVKHNIHGLDIDKRAYQLAYFAVMMKGRGYNRRFFSGKDGELSQPKIYAIQESNKVNRVHLKYFGVELSSFERDNALIQIEELLKIFIDARVYGSILNVDIFDWELLERFIDNYEQITQINFDYMGIDETKKVVKKIIQTGKLLSEKFDNVITNPPYMGRRKSMNDKLSGYIDNYYPDSKMDLFSVFIENNIRMTKRNGYSSYMTPFVWMYLNSYTELRKKMLDSIYPQSIIQLESSSFQDAAVSICTFVLRKANLNYRGIGINLAEFPGEEKQASKVLEAKRNDKCSYLYCTLRDMYRDIPDCRFVFWISPKTIMTFENNTLETIAAIKQGITTSDNERFLKLWHEVQMSKIGFGLSQKDAKQSQKKWFPYSEGGEKRKWFGNNEYIINYENDGAEIKAFHDVLNKTTPGGRLKNREFYFKRSITWSDICGTSFAARSNEQGFLFDVKGSCAFVDDDLYDYVLAFLNSKVAVLFCNMLNPSVTTQVGDIKQIPIIVAETSIKEEIEKSAKICKKISEKVWNSYEKSWGFKKHPLIQDVVSIEDAYNNYVLERKRDIEQVICEEEKINKHFFELYGLSNEAECKVYEHDITIEIDSMKTIISSFVSYGVGCILGRYSIDRETIVHAGGEWRCTKYSGYIPVLDNVISITDDEYLENDIVVKFCEWLKSVYGEIKLEENLNFIANALGTKGENSREVIRNYFIKDFIQEHIRTYQKRPIYWMFDSGKENGFKAITYMHRYDANTVGKVRIEYLHGVQKSIEQALQRAEYVKDNSANSTEKSKATKQISKYTKQLAEIKQYDEAMAYIANQRVEIDLDDGVKVNYEKFQGVEVAQEGKKALKVDLLAKIK